MNGPCSIQNRAVTNRVIKRSGICLVKIRAVAGQRSSPDLCFATKFVRIYEPVTLTLPVDAFCIGSYLHK